MSNLRKDQGDTGAGAPNPRPRPLVARPTPPPPPPAATATPSSTDPAVVSFRAPSLPQLAPTAWILFGGCAVAAIGTFLPWARVTSGFGTEATFSPSGGAVVFFLCLLGAVAWLGWPLGKAALSLTRRVSMTVLAGGLVLLAITNFSSFANANVGAGSDTDVLSTHVQPGVGLYAYGLGVAAIVVAVVRIWRDARREQTGATS